MNELDTAKILGFGLELFVWMTIGYLGYIIRVQLSRVALTDWVGATWHTIFASYVFGALVCVALVISANAAEALGLLGFNAEQGMAVLAGAIVAPTIGIANLIAKEKDVAPGQ